MSEPNSMQRVLHRVAISMRRLNLDDRKLDESIYHIYHDHSA